MGGCPANNEWDKYIVNFLKHLIKPDKTLDSVFHYTRDVPNNTGVYTWCQDTPSIDSSK